jgi:hypothetical protein
MTKQQSSRKQSSTTVQKIAKGTVQVGRGYAIIQFIIVTLLCCASIAYGMYLKKHPDTTHTQIITATVTSLNCTPSSNQLVNCLVNLSYTYNNSTYTLTNILLQNQKSANIATVGIFINPSNPMDYILGENHTTSMTGTYYILAGIVVFIVSAILLVIVMKSDFIAGWYGAGFFINLFTGW